MRYLTRTIWILSLISLFTDMASEMLYPIMPMYLKSIGFSVVLIGILEGVAEAVAGLSKGWFGKYSDYLGRRAPFVQLGYAMSAISKPMMAVWIYPLWVFAARTIDRIGKGVRTGARDALLSDEATKETKGKVFGFHRSMDTMGAVLGPAIALVFLYFYPGQYRMLFLWAFIPGMLAVLATFWLKDKPKAREPGMKPKPTLFAFMGYWKVSPDSYRRLVAGLLVFALFNSSDIFLLLKAKEMGLDDTQIIGVYIFYNLIYAFSAFPMGILADKIGLKPVFIAGLCVYAMVYFGMAFCSGIAFCVALFLLYGLYAAATEGISKAWISNMCQASDTATAIGFYTGFQSLAALLASSLTGFVWYLFGGATAFIVTGAVSLILACYFYFFVAKEHA